jgi:predicted ATPase
LPGNTQYEFRNSALNPHLVSTPFKVQTSWHVITGASCSGKTTLIDQLAEHGFKTVPEVARDYIEREKAKGLTIEEIRADQAALTRQVYQMMIEREQRLRTIETAFLDRGLPDACAFFRYAGMDPNQVLLDCFQYRYASVFLLDRLPYQRDGVRAADDETAEYFDAWMSRDYHTLGYEVLRVPVLAPEDRLDYVLQKLSKSGLNY